MAGIFAVGIFAVGTLEVKFFAVWMIGRTEFASHGILAVRIFRCPELSPYGIFAVWNFSQYGIFAVRMLHVNGFMVFWNSVKLNFSSVNQSHAFMVQLYN